MNGTRTRSVQTLCILLIFTLFAAASLLLVLIGANVSRGVSARMDENDSIEPRFPMSQTKCAPATKPGKSRWRTREKSGPSSSRPAMAETFIKPIYIGIAAG